MERGELSGSQCTCVSTMPFSDWAKLADAQRANSRASRMGTPLFESGADYGTDRPIASAEDVKLARGVHREANVRPAARDSGVCGKRRVLPAAGMIGGQSDGPHGWVEFPASIRLVPKDLH